MFTKLMNCIVRMINIYKTCGFLNKLNFMKKKNNKIHSKCRNIKLSEMRQKMKICVETVFFLFSCFSKFLLLEQKAQRVEEKKADVSS